MPLLWRSEIPHSLVYVSAWFSVDESAWKVSGGVVLWEKVCQWGWALDFNSLCPIFPDKDMNSQLLTLYHICLPVAMFPTMMVMDSNPLQLSARIKCFLS